MNRAALRALKSHRLAEYLQDEGITMVMDNSSVLNLFLGSQSAGGRVVDYERIMYGSREGVPGWAAYRIRQPVGAHGTTTLSAPGPSGNR